MSRVTIGLFILLFALPAVAGEPQERPKWWQGQQAKDLGLATDQSARIDGIYQQARPRIQAAMQDLDQARGDLSKLIAGDKTTEVEVVRQLGVVQASRSEVDRQTILMLFRMYRELTPEQRVKLKALRDQQQREREGRRGDDPHPPQRKK